jgi:2-polyprenyl-3-methyl-5-hydroxy-6-metoxy-1,4-benzoquinol methylase
MFWIALIVAIVCIIVIIVDLLFLLSTVHGAIYYPSSKAQIRAMLKLAHVKPSDKAVDIGSGDGRIVRAIAMTGAEAYGYEINPLLVMWSWWQNHRRPLKNAHFRWANLWLTNFARFQVVTIFGMTYIMKDLETKLLKELKPGARVVCNSFPFPHWKPLKKLGSVYLYQKK